jgi:hypothetical protein
MLYLYLTNHKTHTMDTSNKSGKVNIENDEQDHLKGIEHDNDTYGHSETPFIRKDEPDENHHEETTDQNNKLGNSDKLKNINLSAKEDIGVRNADTDKGVGGKDL